MLLKWYNYIFICFYSYLCPDKYFYMRYRFLALIAFITIILGFATPVWAEVWSADNIEMVHLKDRTRYVCDPDGILSADVRTASDRYLDSLRRGCGIQAVFVVANRVKGGDTFRMAQDIGNKYGVGDKETRRGLVVVIAVEDRRYTIAPGKGLEADFTDVETRRMADAYVVPNMRRGNTGMAVLETSKALLAKFKTGKMPLPKDTEGGETTAADWVVIIILLLMIFGIPLFFLLQSILLQLGVIKKPWIDPKKTGRNGRNRRNDRDNFPPFIFFGGGGSRGGGGPIGGSFGGGSFGGGGSSGSW